MQEGGDEGPLVRWYSREKYPDLAYASLMLDKHLVGKLKKKTTLHSLHLSLFSSFYNLSFSSSTVVFGLWVGV